MVSRSPGRRSTVEVTYGCPCPEMDGEEATVRVDRMLLWAEPDSRGLYGPSIYVKVPDCPVCGEIHVIEL